MLQVFGVPKATAVKTSLCWISQILVVCTHFFGGIERNRARMLIVGSEFEAFDKALLPLLSQELVNVVVGKRVAPLVD
jgi:hypothetical protein